MVTHLIVTSNHGYSLNGNSPHCNSSFVLTHLYACIYAVIYVAPYRNLAEALKSKHCYPRDLIRWELHS